MSNVRFFVTLDREYLLHVRFPGRKDLSLCQVFTSKELAEQFKNERQTSVHGTLEIIETDGEQEFLRLLRHARGLLLHERRFYVLDPDPSMANAQRAGIVFDVDKRLAGATDCECQTKVSDITPASPMNGW
jgi:hypothetical protein